MRSAQVLVLNGMDALLDAGAAADEARATELRLDPRDTWSSIGKGGAGSM
jgi:hypothetical protein